MEARRDAWQIYRESLPILIVSLAGGIFAGSVLGSEGMTEGFERFPGLLLLLPAFLATRGNVYGAMGARISSGLHQGMIDPSFSWNRRLVNAVAASFINGIGISVFIGVLSWAILWVLGRDSAGLIELVGIMLISGVLTSTTLIFGLLALVFASYERGLDPDNLIGPIVTTLGDVFGVVFLFVAITVVGGIF
ncbi:magnesium transporter [Natrinema longum]|uniref:Magnesium transporter n=1 Tax=Natrinema longum TaxID=370324 RepID=A0A8A2UGD8_9EURY|nr:magnesium transporter [Natrinema longum]MBZ6495195.1 magnesium transporter [Natrinema longum]QSW86825.1 magnesium transporter [Natrinema longum]